MLDLKPDSRGNPFRAARIARLKLLVEKTLSSQTKCRILDVGGTYNFWHTWRDEIDWSRTEIVCVNYDPTHFEHGSSETRVTMIKGDARDLGQFQNNAFDIVFSNSVIEHVGLWHDMEAMARQVRRIAPRYMVQTPNFWFPIEPHARFPFLHWLPEPWAYRIVMMRKCGFWPKAQTVTQAVIAVQSARMIDFRQMRELFNDAVIERERFLGLTKSLVAVRE
jgi:Methyltransferase domain